MACGGPRGPAHRCWPRTESEGPDSSGRSERNKQKIVTISSSCQENTSDVQHKQGPLIRQRPRPCRRARQACGDRGAAGQGNMMSYLRWDETHSIFSELTGCVSHERQGQRCRRKSTEQPDIQRWLLIQSRAATCWRVCGSEFWSLQNHRSLSLETCRRLRNIKVSMTSRNRV